VKCRKLTPAFFSALVGLSADWAWSEESMPPASLVPDHWSNILLVFFALMCVVAVWFVWRQRKIASTGIDYRLQMVGSIAFGTKERLVMVKIKDRILLLGVTAHQINLIKELPEADFLVPNSLPSGSAGNMAPVNTNNAASND
jgi:flagellar protein FliO/FliZ